MDMSNDPESSSFRKAMRLAGGVLLILDNAATPFKRIWCDFEIYSTLTNGKMLDIVSMLPADNHRSPKQPKLLSQDPLPKESPWNKQQREQSFPIELLVAGVSPKLEEGEASVASDKDLILQTMAKAVQNSNASNAMSQDD